jgi:hypothetical protein
MREAPQQAAEHRAMEAERGEITDIARETALHPAQARRAGEDDDEVLHR